MNKIEINRIKTKDDFNGLRFKTNIFKEKIDDLKNTISKNCEDIIGCPTHKQEEHQGKILKLVDKLNENITTKITKIKAFYESKINKIYDSLQNGKKVHFNNLKDYDADNKVSNFSYKDFDLIGSELRREQITCHNFSNVACIGIFLTAILILIMILSY